MYIRLVEHHARWLRAILEFERRLWLVQRSILRQISASEHARKAGYSSCVHNSLALLKRLLRLSVLILSCLGIGTSQTKAACNTPPRDAISYLSLPGRPFGIAVTQDGCDVFVALMGNPSGIALLRRANGKIKLEKVFSLKGRATDIVLTHDQKLLIVAGIEDVAFLDVERMLSGHVDPVLGYLSDADAGSINVNVTADDQFLFVSDEAAARIRVIDLAKVRGRKFSSEAIIGKIPVGLGPIALVFSPDEKLLYTTSEIAAKMGWEDKCKPEANSGGPLHPEGAVIVVDVATAKTNPEHAVLKWLPAGCSPVRMAISSSGDFLYVTARGSDAVLVYATAQMLSDPAQSLIATVPTGTAPVGITVADAGKKLLAANSNRFSEGGGSVTVIDAGKVSNGTGAVLGKISAQSFPREFATSPDGATIFLSNFKSSSLEIIDVARMKIK